MIDRIIELDKRNPIIASRIVKVFSRWWNYIKRNKELMYVELLRLQESKLSENTSEVIELMLN